MIVALGLSFAGSCKPEPVEVGATTPDLGLPVNDRPAVVWGVRPRDCLVCQNVTREIRMAQGRSGTDIDYIVVVLGTDRGIVSSFLKVERIQAQVAYLPPNEFRDVFGGLQPPFLLVSDGQRIRDLWVGPTDIAAAASPKGNGDPSSFQEAIERTIGAGLPEPRLR